MNGTLAFLRASRLVISSLLRTARRHFAKATRAVPAIFLFLTHGVSAITIDDFNINHPTITGVGASTVDAGGILGGERDLRVTVTAGNASDITAGASNGVLFDNRVSAVTAESAFTWDGNDNDASTLNFGLGPANLTTGGDNAFILGVNTISGSPTITLEVFSSAANWSSFTLANPPVTPTSVRIPFAAFGIGGGSGATFSSVAAIRLRIAASVAGNVKLDFLRTGSTTAPTPLEATLTDIVLVDNDGNGKASAGDTLRYVVTITNTTASTTLSNVQYNAPAVANASAAANITATPIARDDAPPANSVPGNPFHGAFNTTLTVAANAGLLTNDFVGEPSATISTFGGGSAGGTITSFAAGATANVAAGSLTVNADGSLTFVPITGFNGPFTFQYRLTNSKGTSDATATIAIGTRVAAVADARTATGNVRINTSAVTAFSVLDNDAGDGKAVSAMSVTSTQGGQVAHLGNGQFTYNPPPGFEGSDTFSYTITNGFGSSNATVTINVNGMIWFIDATAGAGGDGRLTSPFNLLTGAGSFVAVAADDPGDNIFIADGSYTGPLTLLNNQKLIGDGSSGTLAAVAGITLAPNSDGLPNFSGFDPVIAAPSGDGVTLGSGNTIRGITVGDTPGGFGFSGGNAGTLTISESSKTGSGGALNLGSGTSITATFDLLNSSNAPAQAINLINVSGSIAATSGSITNPAGTAVFISSGNGNLTYPGFITKNTAGRLIDISFKSGGTITFNGNFTNSGAGINVVSNSAGNISFAGSSKVLNTSGNVAVTLATNTGTTINFSNGGLDVDTTTATAFLVQGGGTVNVSGSGNAINSTTGTAFVNSGFGGSATIDINAGITNTSGRLIDIQNRAQANNVTISGNLNNAGSGILCNNISAGTITFSGVTKTLNTGANAAVSLTSNAGGTINFTGGSLAISTGSGTGFNATGGATAISVTGSGNTINSSSGTALNVVNTTLGASRLTFQSISSGSGSPTGIILDGTGTSGGLTVTGTGSAGSGGTLANKSGGDGVTTSGIGIYMNNTSNHVFNSMQINDCQNFGIRGTNVGNCNITNTVVNGANGTSTALREGSVIFDNIFGTCSLVNSTVRGAIEDNVRAENDKGSLTSFVVAGCTIGNNNTTSGNIGFRLAGRNSANMTAFLDSSLFQGNRTDSINVDAGDSSTVNMTITNNTIVAGIGGNNQGNLGIDVTAGVNGSMTFKVEGNKVGTPDGTTQAPLLNTGINIFGGGNAACNIVGTVRNNKVILAGTGMSGIGIRLVQADASVFRVNVDGNTVSNVGLDYGIQFDGGQNAGAAGTGHLAIVNNNASVLSTAIDAVRVRVRNGSVLTARIEGNTTTAPAPAVGLSVSQGNTAKFNLEDDADAAAPELALGGRTAAQINTYIIGKNPLANSTEVFATVDPGNGTSGFHGVAFGTVNVP